MSDANDHTIIVHVPSLLATLIAREREKGGPLTEPEVLEIRDTAPARVIARDDLWKLIERRGYEDIDPENCWVEWRAFRDRPDDPDDD